MTIRIAKENFSKSYHIEAGLSEKEIVSIRKNNDIKETTSIQYTTSDHYIIYNHNDGREPIKYLEKRILQNYAYITTQFELPEGIIIKEEVIEYIGKENHPATHYLTAKDSKGNKLKVSKEKPFLGKLYGRKEVIKIFSHLNNKTIILDSKKLSLKSYTHKN
ncbi:MAG: hypothetical protein HYU63_00090 [Armatimonadetes bacterium]|nr:hypothetical protein [Armatimonadota bacterium]